MVAFARQWLKFQNRDSIVFLLVIIGINLVFKTAIGLFLTFNGYGFSVVTPPVSLLFTSLDNMLAIGTFFIVDKIPAKTFRAVAHHFVVVFSIVFLYSNFLVYHYFRTFINWGLICFNGAGATELASYVVNDLLALILLISFFTVSYAVYFFRKKLLDLLFKRQIIFLGLVIVSLVIFLFLAQLGRAETGKMVRSPLIELFGSFVKERIYKDKDIDTESFIPPESLVFGKSNFENSSSAGFTHDKVENVLVIMVESLSLEMTSVLNPDEKSFEIIDKLKENSIILDSYRTIFPGTSRSFIAANCGTLSGTAQETITNYMYDFRCNSVADVFNLAGYETGFFASSMFTYDNLSSSGFAKKYKVFKDFLSLKSKHGKDNDFYSYQVKDSDTAQEAYDFMSDTENKGGKFFTFLFLYSTHYPYDSPFTTNEKKGSVENYRKAQSYVSSVIEDLLDKMEDTGILGNTAVVITADHGEAFGKRPGVYGHGQSLYEESIKIPLIIRLPGLKNGFVSHKNGTHIDLAPTLTALAGIESHNEWSGIDLLDREKEERPAFIFTRSATRLSGIVDGNYKYIYNITEKEEQLFDLTKDPDELENIAQEKINESKYYRTLVEQWAAHQQKWITTKK